jgi:hypothetical protein
MLLHGQCHCGQIEVSFETAIPVDKLEVRACQCSFCRRHGAKTVTDPNGHLTISAPQGALSRYRFGLKITDYLLCKNCGVYVAAVMDDGGREIATLNVAAMRIDGLCEREALPARFDGETVEARRERRRRGWTPAHIVTSALRKSG